ncbi:hypothetical protein [Streptomyces sp. NPDC055287]
MTPSSPSAPISAREPRAWTPQWTPDQTNTDLPPVTIISDPDDLPACTTSALAAHRPADGRITIHPTPLATAPAYLAHDFLRALGKHLPPSDSDVPWWTTNTDDSWRIAAAWTRALGISHYVLARAHRIPSRHWEHLMALRENTGIHLTLVVSGPVPAALHSILTAVQHHYIDNPDEGSTHLSRPGHPPSPAPYPWWHAAPFPPGEDEQWYQLPPRPKQPRGRPGEPSTDSRGKPTQLASDRNPPRAIPLEVLTPSSVPPAIAQRIHTRIAHPVHAAAVALRTVTGYETDQLRGLAESSTAAGPQPPIVENLPAWVSLLTDAAYAYTQLQSHARQGNPFSLATWDRHDIAHATEACHLLAPPSARRPVRIRHSLQHERHSSGGSKIGRTKPC